MTKKRPEPSVQRSSPPAGASRGAAARWTARFARNLLWAAPLTVLVWVLITPFYNRFLAASAESFVRLTEHPAQTRLDLREGQYAVASRRDFGTRARDITRGRVTDCHFNLLLLGSLFLAVPKLTLSQRFGNLGWALLIAMFFHILLLSLLVKFTYATQMGDYSLAHYGPFARNAYGLLTQLMDLPFKFALPLILWTVFYLRRVPRAA
ncbi:MAG: hypothetical protein ABI609_18805 [Acidobacteriota bacterium]